MISPRGVRAASIAIRLYLLAIPVALLAGLLWLAVPSADAQGQACVWGNPSWTEYDSPTNHTVVVKVPCAGGIVGCSGMVRSYLSVFDPLLMQWTYCGSNPRLDAPLYRTCGSSVNIGDSVSNASLPRGTYCCLEVQWWESFGGTYLLMDSRQHFFWTP